jgi:hypothetical protein
MFAGRPLLNACLTVAFANSQDVTAPSAACIGDTSSTPGRAAFSETWMISRESNDAACR